MFRNIVTILTDSVPQTVFSKPYHIPGQKHVPKKYLFTRSLCGITKIPFGSPKQTESTGNGKSLPTPPEKRGLWPGGRHDKNRQKKWGFPERHARREPPTKECGGALLSHTLSSAVPSPQPGLSFRVRKGTGHLTWAMTTAKPIQTPPHREAGRQRNPTRTPPWRSGNRTTDANKLVFRFKARR